MHVSNVIGRLVLRACLFACRELRLRCESLPAVAVSPIFSAIGRPRCFPLSFPVSPCACVSLRCSVVSLVSAPSVRPRVRRQHRAVPPLSLSPTTPSSRRRLSDSDAALRRCAALTPACAATHPYKQRTHASCSRSDGVAEHGREGLQGASSGSGERDPQAPSGGKLCGQRGGGRH